MISRLKTKGFLYMYLALPPHPLIPGGAPFRKRWTTQGGADEVEGWRSHTLWESVCIDKILCIPRLYYYSSSSDRIVLFRRAPSCGNPYSLYIMSLGAARIIKYTGASEMPPISAEAHRETGVLIRLKELDKYLIMLYNNPKVMLATVLDKNYSTFFTKIIVDLKKYSF